MQPANPGRPTPMPAQAQGVPMGAPPQGMPPQAQGMPMGGPPQGMPPQAPQGMPAQAPQGAGPQGDMQTQMLMAQLMRGR